MYKNGASIVVNKIIPTFKNLRGRNKYAIIFCDNI